jgi:protein AATF/BFR2
LVKGVVPDQNTNIEKAKHIRAQFQLWDALVETRIRLQPVLALANRLPQHTTFNTFKSGSAAERKRAHASCAAAVGELLKLQKSLLVQGKIGDNGEADDTSVGAARKRLKTAAEALEVHEAQHSSMEDYTHETLEKWFTKTNLSRTKTNTKKFRALDRSVMQQVEQVRRRVWPCLLACLLSPSPLPFCLFSHSVT